MSNETNIHQSKPPKINLSIAALEIEKIYSSYDMNSQEEMTKACELIDYYLDLAGCNMLDYIDYGSGVAKLN